MPATITPAPGSKQFKNKIVILVNMYSISMAELTTMALKALPYTIVVGERTYGATGLLTTQVDLNSGSFQVGDFATIKIASALFKFKNNKLYEGIGYPPDINVPYSAPSNNIDAQLEAAIKVFAP